MTSGWKYLYSLAVTVAAFSLWTVPLYAQEYIFENSQSWVAPQSGQAVIECWGGGSGGGVSNSGEGGGGGGAYVRSTYNLEQGVEYWIWVGNGGQPGQDPYFAGGRSGFGTTPRVPDIYAVGGTTGQGRVGGAGGSANVSVGEVRYSGGNGGSSSGGNAGGGGGGSSASPDGDGNPGADNVGGQGGAGGSAPFDGGAGGTGGNNQQNGQSAWAVYPGNFGGGGGGGGAHANAGSGAIGRVRITYVSPNP